jgi:hypothetical protein
VRPSRHSVPRICGPGRGSLKTERRNGSCWRILLQKSKVASVRIFGETLKHEKIDDSDIHPRHRSSRRSSRRTEWCRCDGQPAIVRSMTGTLKSLPLGHWPLGMRAADGTTHQSFCRSGIDVEDHHVGPWRVGHHKSGLQRSRYWAVVRGRLGEISNLHSRGREPDIHMARLVGR